ncbi:hypothetical protein Tco_0601401 [Tanacetum coccineum]
MDRDHSEQLLTDLAEARRKKKRNTSHQKHQLGLHLPQHTPLPPPPAVLFGNSRASANLDILTAVLFLHLYPTNHKLSLLSPSIPEDLHMDADSAPDEKPLPEEDIPATPKPAWSIPSSDLLVPMNNWASALASYLMQPHAKNSLLCQTGLPSKVIQLQYQMEECQKLLTDQVDDAIIRHNVSKPLPLGGQPGQMEYLPKRKWSKQYKQRARVMINAIDKKLRDRRLMRSLEKFVGGRPFYTSAGNPVKEILLKLNLPDHRLIFTDSKVTPTKHGRMTKPYSPPCFIANCFNAGYLKMEVKVPVSS